MLVKALEIGLVWHKASWMIVRQMAIRRLGMVLAALALDPGLYLACASRYCVNIAVSQGQMTTLNVRLLYGPTQFIIADATEPALHQVTGLAATGAI